MAEYDNTNTGRLYIKDKGDNPKRPDRGGDINIDGKEYWLSGWMTNSKGEQLKDKDGKPWLRLTVKPKDAPAAATKPAAKPAATFPAGFDDGIDF